MSHGAWSAATARHVTLHRESEPFVTLLPQIECNHPRETETPTASPGAPPTLLEGPIAPLREAQPTGDWAFETLAFETLGCQYVLRSALLSSFSVGRGYMAFSSIDTLRSVTGCTVGWR